MRRVPFGINADPDSEAKLTCGKRSIAFILVLLACFCPSMVTGSAQAASDGADAAKRGAESTAVSSSPAEKEGDSFGWAWQEKDAAPAARAAATTPPAAVAAPSAPPAATGKAPDMVSASAYKELLQENLELRKKMTEITAEKLESEKQREDLDRRVRALEQGVKEATAQLDRQQKAKIETPEDLDKLVEADLKAAPAAKAAEAVAVPAERSVDKLAQPGSDLYRQMEKESFRLKEKLAETEAEKEKLLKAQDEMLKEHKTVLAEKKALELQMEKIKLSDKDQKKTVGTLLDRMPQMENDLAEMRRKLSERDSALEKKDRDLVSLKQELAQRENRLIKAEHMTALLDRTKEEVRQVSEKEKRDMHYNMATVYGKEGRYREAEEEYLRALKVDPTDAESHYNLALLYDEEFHDQRQAAMHYRRYLKLRPNAPDVDAVKDWLLNLEMGGKSARSATSDP